jgi:hypothetical protein
MDYSHFGCNMRKLGEKKKTLQVYPCKVSCPWTQQRDESEKKQTEIWPEEGPYPHTAPLNFILRAAEGSGEAVH